MAIKKSLAAPMKTSRSGKYTFSFLDGIYERWEIAKEQAKMNYQIDMKNQEARIKIYRERLKYLDGKLDTLQKERRSMEASQLTNQQKVNNANAKIKTDTAKWNAGKKQEVELKEMGILSTRATGARTVVDVPGTGGSAGRTSSTGPTDNIAKLGDEDVMRQVSDNIRNADTDADIINIGMSTVAGKGSWQANQTAVQQTASKANALNQMEARERARLANAGQPVSDAIVKRNVAAVFANGNQGGTYADLSAAREAMKTVSTTTGGTGPRATTYKTVGGNKGVIRGDVTPANVTETLQQEVKPNYKPIDDAIADVIAEREGLVAPKLGLDSMDLIGDTRRIYGDKFGRSSGEEARVGMRKLLDLGELYGPEAMQAAVAKLQANRAPAAEETFERAPDVSGALATDNVSGPMNAAGILELSQPSLNPNLPDPQGPSGIPRAPDVSGAEAVDTVSDTFNDTGDFLEQPSLNPNVKLQTTKPKVQVELDPSKAAISTKVSNMFAGKKGIEAMMPKQGDSPTTISKKKEAMASFMDKMKKAEPTSTEGRVYSLYEQVMNNGGDLNKLLDFASVLFNDGSEAQQLVYQLYRIGSYK